MFFTLVKSFVTLVSGLFEMAVKISVHKIDNEKVKRIFLWIGKKFPALLLQNFTNVLFLRARVIKCF